MLEIKFEEFKSILKSIIPIYILLKLRIHILEWMSIIHACRLWSEAEGQVNFFFFFFFGDFLLLWCLTLDAFLDRFSKAYKIAIRSCKLCLWFYSRSMWKSIKRYHWIVKLNTGARFVFAMVVITLFKFIREVFFIYIF